MQLQLPTAIRESKGVVYTKPWVVDLILDMVGYRAEADLSSLVAVEPAAGEGAFLLPMVRRLVSSIKSHERSLDDAERAVLAFELDGNAATWARELVTTELITSGFDRLQSERVARGWVVEGDYLLSSRSAPAADVIVGNPPYIRYDDLPPEAFAAYRKICPTMVGRCDVYVGFIEAGLRQLNHGGLLGFICADRWMRSAYGAELRRFVAENASVEAVIEMHDAPAFENEVSAYPAVTVLRRGAQGPALVGSADQSAGPLETRESLADAIVELAGSARTLPGFRAARLSGWYSGSTPWPWADPKALDLIQHLESRHRPLEDDLTNTKVGIGVATGADNVFVTTDPEIVELDRLLPLAMAADTRTGVVKWSGHYLVDPWSPDGKLVDLTKFPRLAAYYHSNAEALGRRNIATRQHQSWYRTIDRVAHELQIKDKLYFPDMKLRAHPVLDRGETYPHHNLYYIVSDVWDLEVLGGLLLSEIAELFVASYCVKMRGGTLRFQAQYLRRIRVPDPHSIGADVQEQLRSAFRLRDRDAATLAAGTAYGIDTLPSAT